MKQKHYDTGSKVDARWLLKRILMPVVGIFQEKDISSPPPLQYRAKLYKYSRPPPFTHRFSIGTLGILDHQVHKTQSTLLFL